jgi:hypothetical protein
MANIFQNIFNPTPEVGQERRQALANIFNPPPEVGAQRRQNVVTNLSTITKPIKITKPVVNVMPTILAPLTKATTQAKQTFTSTFNPPTEVAQQRRDVVTKTIYNLTNQQSGIKSEAGKRALALTPAGYLYSDIRQAGDRGRQNVSDVLSDSGVESEATKRLLALTPAIIFKDVRQAGLRGLQDMSPPTPESEFGKRAAGLTPINLLDKDIRQAVGRGITGQPIDYTKETETTRRFAGLLPGATWLRTPASEEIRPSTKSGWENVGAIPSTFSEGSKDARSRAIGWMGAGAPVPGWVPELLVSGGKLMSPETQAQYQSKDIYQKYLRGELKGAAYEGQEAGSPRLKFQVPGTKDTALVNVLGQALTPQSWGGVAGSALALTGGIYSPRIAAKGLQLFNPWAVKGVTTTGGAIAQGIYGISGMAAKGYLWPKLAGELGQLTAPEAQREVTSDKGYKSSYQAGVRETLQSASGINAGTDIATVSLKGAGYRDVEPAIIDKYTKGIDSYTTDAKIHNDAVKLHNDNAKAVDDTIKKVGVYNKDTKEYEIQDAAAYTTIQTMINQLDNEKKSLDKETSRLDTQYKELKSIDISDKPSLSLATTLIERKLIQGNNWGKGMTPEQITSAQDIMARPEWQSAYSQAEKAMTSNRKGWIGRNLAQVSLLFGGDTASFQKGVADDARKYYSEQGLTGKALDNKVNATVNAATRDLAYKGIGQAIAALDISRSSETLGQVLTAKSFGKGATYTAAQVSKTSLLPGASNILKNPIFRKTLIPLGTAGFGEGGALYTSAVTAKGQKWDPLQYALYGSIGAVSAATLGGFIATTGAKGAAVTGGTKGITGAERRILGIKAGPEQVSKTTLKGAYFTDIMEYPGDITSSSIRQRAATMMGLESPIEAGIIPSATGVQLTTMGGGPKIFGYYPTLSKAYSSGAINLPIRTTATIMTPTTTPLTEVLPETTDIRENIGILTGVPATSNVPSKISQPTNIPSTLSTTLPTYVPSTVGVPSVTNIVTNIATTTETPTTSTVNTPVNTPVTIPTGWPGAGALWGGGESAASREGAIIGGTNINFLRNFFFEKVRFDKAKQLVASGSTGLSGLDRALGKTSISGYSGLDNALGKPMSISRDIGLSRMMPTKGKGKSSVMLSITPESRMIGGLNTKQKLGDMMGKSYNTKIVNNSAPFPKKMYRRVKM